MITVSTAWKNSAQLSKQVVALVRLHYGDETSYIAISSGSIQGFDEEYRPMLLSSPVSTSGVDMFTHKFQASDISLKVSNGDYHPGVKFSDLFSDTSLGAGNDFGFENRRVDIKLWVPGITTFADCIQYFNGVVRDIQHTDTGIILSIQDKREIIHHEIGTLLTDSDAAETGQGLPEESRSKIKPIIHGNHIYLMGDNSKSLDTVSTIHSLIACAYLGIDSSNKHRWQVASHKLDQINAEGDDSEQQQIWGSDSLLGRFVRLASTFTLEQNDSSGCIISHANDPAFFDYWFSKGTVVGSISGSGTTSNPTNVNDKDYSTSGELAGNVAAVQGSSQRFDVPFANYDDQGLSDDDITEVKILIYGLLTYLGVAGDGDEEVEIGLGEAPFGELLSLSTQYPTGGSFPAARLSSTLATHTLADIGQDQRVQLEKQNNNANTGATFDAYEMNKQIKYTRLALLSLLSGGRGREYDTWINNRTQTETHADNGATGGLIENLAGQIESLYRDELGRVDADFDLASLNVASNDNTDVFAFSITKVVNSLSFIAKLCQDGRSFIWLEPSGKIRMKVLEDTYSSSDRKIDFRTLLAPKFTRTKPQRIFTAVKVKYNWNGSSHIIETAISEDTAMQDKYNVTEAESTLAYDSRSINNSTTAENLRAYLLSQWKQQHNQVEFRVGIEHIDLDLGDIVEFDNVQLKPFGLDITQSNTIAGQDILQYWWIYNVKRSINGATIKAFQLHDLS